jgi:hypothetical protein
MLSKLRSLLVPYLIKVFVITTIPENRMRTILVTVSPALWSFAVTFANAGEESAIEENDFNL